MVLYRETMHSYYLLAGTIDIRDYVVSNIYAGTAYRIPIPYSVSAFRQRGNSGKSQIAGSS